jgi:hypothetical protein
MCFILRGELAIENGVVFFCSNSGRASFAGVSCLQLTYLSPVLSVRRPVDVICLYSRSIISVEFILYWTSDTLWCCQYCLGRADVCVGTTPHP